jgi:hypothetical protein
MTDSPIFAQTSEALSTFPQDAPGPPGSAEPPATDATQSGGSGEPGESDEPGEPAETDVLGHRPSPAPRHTGISTNVPAPSWTVSAPPSAPAGSNTEVIPAVRDEAPAVRDEPPAVREAPALPEPPARSVAAPPLTERESVTCPECGTVGSIVVSRRDAADFCTNCDFPLFWTPSRILLDRAALQDDSLRRLPGTVGRVAVASLPCPHCSEPNAVTAVDCIRCGRPLHPVHVQAPQPVYVPPPAPVYEEPEPPAPATPWWVWLLFYLAVTGALVLIILYATGTLG